MIRFAECADACDAPRPAAVSASPTDPDRIGDEIAELAAHLHAATYRLLVLVAAFDGCEGWNHGFRSCAHWLSWRTGIGQGTAREQVRVARALPELPRISRGMERGELSYAKVRALTRVATPGNEADLVELARHATAAQVERLVRAWRRVDRAEEAALEEARHRARFLTLHPDEDGSWVVRGRLDPEVGALLEKALEAAADELFRASGAEAEPTHGQRMADALGLVAEQALSAEEPVRRADRFQVVLHVTAEGADPAGPAPAILEASGQRVPAETSRRLSCDASRVRVTHDGQGGVLDVGRRSRTVPPAIRRALEARDGSCRFPGCTLRHTDAHHLVHWAEGGETRLDNLVLLCRRHHRAVHEGAVRLVGSAGAAGLRFQFLRPDGRPIAPSPAPPSLEPDPVAALTSRHRRAGIEPDAWTATPLWTGERLDMGHAVGVLRG